MPEGAPLGAPSPEDATTGMGPPAAGRLSRVLTVLAALVVLPALLVMAMPGSLETRLGATRNPERALALVVGRTMDLHEAVTRAPAWQRAVYGALGFEGADDIGQARQWYAELETYSVDPSVDIHTAIFDAETGRPDAVRRRIAAWGAREEPLPALAPLIARAYLGVPADREPITVPRAVIEVLDGGWFLDRLTIALATRSGQADVSAAARARVESRGTWLLQRLGLLVAASLALGVIGVATAIVVLIRLRRNPGAVRAGTAEIPPPWPGWLGAAVLLRGGACGVLVGAALLVYLMFAPPFYALRGGEAAALVLQFGTGLLLVVPALALGRRHLFRPAGLATLDAVGLRVIPGGGRPIVLMVLAVSGVVGVGDLLFGLATDAAGATGHWTEWFQADLVFGDALDVAGALVGAVVLAPVTEELWFRGLLFATLRRRLPWALAALASALAFAALHGYGVQGFASVMWSGLAWAWAYERTRSLWPAMIGHALGNLSASALVLLALR